MKNVFCIIGIFFSVVMTPFASADVFEEIDKEMAALEKILSENPGKCNTSGRMDMTWKMYTTTAQKVFNQTLAEKDGSKTFVAKLQSSDEALHELIQKLDVSLAACEKTSTVTRHLSNIAALRNGEIVAVHNKNTTTDKHLPEKDTDDPRSEMFGETKKLWEQVQNDFAQLKKAMAEMKNRDGSSFAFWKTNPAEREAITARAESRANSYVQDFVGNFDSALYSPLLEENSRIVSNLRQLPDGDTSNTTFDFRETKGVGILTDEAREKIQENESDVFAKQAEQQTVTQFQDVAKTKKTEEELSRLLQGLKSRIRDEQFQVQFDEALTDATISSLQPFHATLLETTVLLESQTEALEVMVNNQNPSQ